MNWSSRFFSLFFNSGVSAAASLFILMACSRLLGVEDYGIYRKFFLSVELVVPVVGMGLAQSVFRFFPDYNKERMLKLCILLVLSFSATFCMLLSFPRHSLIFGLIEGRLHGLEFFYFLGVLHAVGLPIITSFFVDSKKLKAFTRVNVLFSIITAFSISVLCYFTRDFRLLVEVKVVLGVAFLLLGLLYYMSSCRGDFDFSRPELSALDLLKFSLPVAMASAVGIISQSIDKLFVAYFESSEAYAVYVNGATEVPLISLVTGALATSAVGYMSSKCAQGDYASALNSFRGIAEKSCLVLMPIFVFFLINAKGFLILLFGDDYLESWKPFCIYLLLLPIRVVFYGPALIALGKSKVIFYRGVVELFFNFLLSAVLYFYVGSIGLAIATVFVVYAWSVPYNLINIKEGFGVPLRSVLPFKSIAFVLMMSLILSPAAYFPGKAFEFDYKEQFAINFLSYFSAVIAVYLARGIISISSLKRIRF